MSILCALGPPQPDKWQLQYEYKKPYTKTGKTSCLQIETKHLLTFCTFIFFMNSVCRR